MSLAQKTCESKDYDITSTINLLFFLLSAGLFVVVSWVSFLVPPEVVPGRMAMLITLFLVLINIFNTVTTQSPNAEGMNAITAWMLVCMLFVFGALVGYAFLLWRKKKSCLKRHRVRVNKQVYHQWYYIFFGEARPRFYPITCGMQVYDRTEFTKYRRFSSVRSRNTEAFEHFICQFFEEKMFYSFFPKFFFVV